MTLYQYAGLDRWCDTVSGIVEADDIDQARFLLEKTYDDYSSWEHSRLEEVTFDENGVCEVYYG